VHDAPINGGLILVGPGDAGRTFFQRTLACYDALVARSHLPEIFTLDLRAWWGDQFAWALMLDIRTFMAPPPQALNVDGIRVRLLPAADYNFTPISGKPYSPEFLASRHFLHFKGNRKEMQETYLAHMRQIDGSAGGSAAQATRQTVTASS
jgi:hypothetical protein